MRPTASIARVLRDAVVDASPRARRVLVIVLVVWVVMIALQIWDVRHRSGAPVVAELLGALTALLGVLLLVPSWALQLEANRDAARQQRTATPQAIVLALPVLASIGATCFGFALAMLVTRGLLGVELWLVSTIAVVVAGCVVWAIGLVRETTRSLYLWAQEQASAAARAEADAARARLTALQSQMQPHFLFNALNTIAALAPVDGARAERTVLNLSSLLRQTLARGAATVTTLAEEVAFAHAYLEVERERFGDRLQVQINVPSELAQATLPGMTLQPLIENVVKHVVQARLGPTSIVITARHEGGDLHVTVSDDGEGVPAASREGIGLGNLRARLAALYGARGRLGIESSAGGTRVTVVVPATP
jgi:sensor histidine kinase YesM